MDTQLKDSEAEDGISPSTTQRIGNGRELCLLCCSKLARKEKIEKVVSESLVEHNLFVIFLLKNVLQVPDSQLEENLKELGNPVDWIRLCEQCTQLAAHALNLHCQIVKLDRELWEAQKLIVEKTKQSSTNLVAAQTVWGRTRQFVKNCKPSNDAIDMQCNLINVSQLKFKVMSKFQLVSRVQVFQSTHSFEETSSPRLIYILSSKHIHLYSHSTWGTMINLITKTLKANN